MRARLLALLLGCPLVAQAQPATDRLMRPGDSRLRPVCAEPRVDSLLVVRRGADGRVTSLARTIVTRIPMIDRGADACFAWQTHHGDSDTSADSALLVRRTLAPTWFRNEEVPAMGPVRRESVTADGAVFLAPFDILLYESLPVAPGLTIDAAAINPGRGPVTMRIAVDSSETLSIGAQDVPAWRLTMDAGATPTVVWVHRATGRFLRSRSVTADGIEIWRLRAGDDVPARR